MKLCALFSLILFFLTLAAYAADNEIVTLQAVRVKGKDRISHKIATDCYVTIEKTTLPYATTITIASASVPSLNKRIAISRNILPLKGGLWNGRFDAGMWHARYNGWFHVLSAESRSYESGYTRYIGFEAELPPRGVEPNPNPHLPIYWAQLKIKMSADLTRIKWVKTSLKIDNSSFFGKTVNYLECHF